MRYFLHSDHDSEVQADFEELERLLSGKGVSGGTVRRQKLHGLPTPFIFNGDPKKHRPGQSELKKKGNNGS